MGWIKRNRFWFEHHDLYIEPTEEEKMIAYMKANYTRDSTRNILMATAVLQGMLSYHDRRR